MNKLRKIQYNCRKATYLIEKQQIGRITLREKLELKIHLAGCSICRIFQQQSILINSMIKKRLYMDVESQIVLDDEFKTKLQEKIDRKLNKN